jgi:SAM-dependent methyltransferase
MSVVAERLPHAILDGDSRLLKATKIAAVVGEVAPLEGAQLLDVGTGSGHIAAVLAQRVGPGGHVCSVDIRDQRRATGGYDFTRVAGLELPFPDASFDIVVANHVIEHVGDRHAQLGHLREVRRVLKDDGVVYLAVPSRWVLVEPHFRLALLSWLPRALRSPYVRLARRGGAYDCELLSRRELRRLAGSAGLRYEDATIGALRALVRIEGGTWLRRTVANAGPLATTVLAPLSPTIVVLLRPVR